MVKTTGPTNYQARLLLNELDAKSRESNLWKRVVKDLKKPSRQRRIINLYKINKFARDGETILVPGKVLSVGELDKKVDIAAMNFSNGAKEKIINAKGKAMSIQELFKANPEGKKIRILG
ncbi:50S ribosomal protein L18e [Candidatus Woesearchaeota archaeon]|jgi:large subunit ribosomal protein L18e|nr:50S ribosomal protein L18e [Candidatus Woesearchaeota archaeon]MBT4110836.1 50S ribosomal protein L18e [Candidatus Woesearchaeota archaeon]MBT4336652.1 50S ribosomal protein L18e [Candidatus Woesearchaeota archaeon]MBT4469599.1 50S ribosomal protein L18e [Candidatus Woesearchaeota archaeon]MBT6743961.1 50S ribosomal protein L18e [Candidatus Woesearchaeota archaeon]